MDNIILGEQFKRNEHSIFKTIMCLSEHYSETIIWFYFGHCSWTIAWFYYGKKTMNISLIIFSFGHSTSFCCRTPHYCACIFITFAYYLITLATFVQTAFIASPASFVSASQPNTPLRILLTSSSLHPLWPITTLQHAHTVGLLFFGFRTLPSYCNLILECDASIPFSSVMLRKVCPPYDDCNLFWSFIFGQ